MSFFGITAGATAKCAGTVLAFAEGVSASTGAVCSLTEAVTAYADVVCSFRWSYFRWSRFLCFRLGFLFWKIYLMKF